MKLLLPILLLLSMKAFGQKRNTAPIMQSTNDSVQFVPFLHLDSSFTFSLDAVYYGPVTLLPGYPSTPNPIDILRLVNTHDTLHVPAGVKFLVIDGKVYEIKHEVKLQAVPEHDINRW